MSVRARRLLTGALLVIGLLGVYLGTMPTERTINDVSSAEVASWRIATTGAPWLDGLDLHRLPHLGSDRLWTAEVPGGHLTISRSPGVMVASVPAYWLRSLVTGEGRDPAHFSLVPGQVTAVVLTVATLLLLWLSLADLVGLATRTLAVGLLGLTTPVWTVAAGGLYPHTVDLLGIAGMAWAARRERWWLAGLFGGLALWGRLHMAVVIAVLGLGLAVLRRRPRIALEAGLPSVLLLAIASLWSHAVFGRWSPTGGYGTPGHYATGAAHDDHLSQLIGYAGFLVSPDRGLFVWTPVLLLLIPAVVRYWRAAPDWTRLLAIGGVCYLLVQGMLDAFHGGSGFYGYRLTLETLACAFPLLVVSAHRMGAAARALVGPLLGLQGGAFAIGAISHGFLVHQQDVWRDNSLWLAVRTFPWLLGFLALTTLVGALAAQAWRDRSLGRPLSAAAAPAVVSAPVGPRPG